MTMRQLRFPFIIEPDREAATSPRPSAYRKRLKRVAEMAYALGLRRRARAESVAGELLKQMDKAKGAREPGTSRGMTRCENQTASPKTLSELGISKQQSSDWQKPLPTIPFHADARERNELHELARRVQRLTVSRTDPESFWVEKSEIANELRRIVNQGSLPLYAKRG
jgi:hypothetical protein